MLLFLCITISRASTTDTIATTVTTAITFNTLSILQTANIGMIIVIKYSMSFLGIIWWILQCILVIFYPWWAKINSRQSSFIMIICFGIWIIYKFIATLSNIQSPVPTIISNITIGLLFKIEHIRWSERIPKFTVFSISNLITMRFDLVRISKQAGL